MFDNEGTNNSFWELEREEVVWSLTRVVLHSQLFYNAPCTAREEGGTCTSRPWACTPDPSFFSRCFSLVVVAVDISLFSAAK